MKFLDVKHTVFSFQLWDDLLLVYYKGHAAFIEIKYTKYESVIYDSGLYASFTRRK